MILRGTEEGLFHVGVFCAKPGTLRRRGNHMSLGPAASRGSILCTTVHNRRTALRSAAWGEKIPEAGWGNTGKCPFPTVWGNAHSLQYVEICVISLSWLCPFLMGKVSGIPSSCFRSWSQGNCPCSGFLKNWTFPSPGYFDAFVLMNFVWRIIFSCTLSESTDFTASRPLANLFRIFRITPIKAVFGLKKTLSFQPPGMASSMSYSDFIHIYPAIPEVTAVICAGTWVGWNTNLHPVPTSGCDPNLLALQACTIWAVGEKSLSPTEDAGAQVVIAHQLLIQLFCTANQILVCILSVCC